MIVVAISDTHGYHRELKAVPKGDLLIHAGDLTRTGQLADVEDFDAWLGSLPHPHKVVIAGNHDWCFEREPREARDLIHNAVYLEDQATEVGGLRIYGSPWQPWFLDWAFNLPRGARIATKWALIPEGTDILITHGPPYEVGDLTCSGHHVGCEDLLVRVHEVRPRLHIFGHIHEAAGEWEREGTVFVNASTSFGEGRARVFTLNVPGAE